MQKRYFIVLIGILLLSIHIYPAIVVTTPATAETIASADDFASDAFGDPWDMNERTDMGWFTYDVTSGSKSNLSSITYSNGIFSATANSSGPQISVLDTGVTGTCFLGKIGTNYKINASKYTIFAIRMRASVNHDALLYWSNNTIYNGITSSNSFSIKNEWRVYFINIPSLGAVAVSGSKINWSGNIDSLRFDPFPKGGTFDIDWIRLVENDNSLYRTVNWDGNSGNVDIYLDTDNNEGNGTLGKVIAGKSGSSYSLFVGGLAPGTYYVGVKNSSGGSIAYAPGYYVVNNIPSIDFTSPKKEGGDDFATVEIGNAWDMNSTSDLDLTYRVNNLSISTVNVEDLVGDYENSVKVLKGTNPSGSRDPVLYPLLWWGDGRGQTYPIDTSKYRILVLNMGLPGNWDLNGGSIARVIWKRVGDGDNENVSEDIVLRHKSGGRLVMNTIIADMASIPLESNSANKSGWTGAVEGFRLDPHEFSAATTFYVRSIKIAAYEKADKTFSIQWDYNDSDADKANADQAAATSTLSLYRDNNAVGYNGTLIGTASPSAGSYTWNTTNLAAGTYYIYGIVSDGLNSYRAYARWPIKVDHSVAETPTISLSKSSLTFTASGSQAFTVSNSGTGTLNWTATDNVSWLSVSPASGSNSGTVTATVSTSGLAAGTYSGTITVSSTNATNSPRTVSVALTVADSGGTPTISLSKSAMIFGAVGSSVTGSQSVLINNTGSGTLHWTAADNASWLSVSPSSGTNSGQLAVSVSKSGLSNGTYSGTVTVSASGASNSPRTIAITFKVQSSGSVPFGQFSTPAGGQTLRSSIPVTGWVLDDVEVVSVKILNSGSYVGDAVFVDGSRPDVEAAYPTTPLNTRAGWGYMMLTNFLPGGGNGSYTFTAVATDKEGHAVTLGSKTVTLDNNGAVLPFGAIDTPSQGGSASGSSFLNWGWALTPLPNTIATNGTTIDVWVNGSNIGHPTYNLYRSDIAGLFPSYNNSNGAVGLKYIDTTNYYNGVYTIQWTAKDNADNTDGIGSRYFTVNNTGNVPRKASGVQVGGLYMADGSLLKAKDLPDFTAAVQSAEVPEDTSGSIWIRRGYDLSEPLQEIRPGENGQTNININQLERLEIHFFSSRENNPLTGTGGLNKPLVAPKLQPITLNRKPMPIGSTLDITRGIYYLQPGYAHLGEFPIHFLLAQRGEWWSKTIKITITPRTN